VTAWRRSGISDSGGLSGLSASPGGGAAALLPPLAVAPAARRLLSSRVYYSVYNSVYLLYEYKSAAAVLAALEQRISEQHRALVSSIEV
jgi:hypothetical protein